MPSAVPSLVAFDLDGTLYQGDDTYRWYAEELDRVRGTEGPGPISVAVANFLATGELVGHDSSQLEDGYQAAALFARSLDVAPAARNKAYQASRARILTEVARSDLRPAGDVASLITDIRMAGAQVALVTNSPSEGLEAMLAHLGLSGSFDHVITSAHKNEHMPSHLRRLADAAGPGARLLSIGDIWASDVAPALEAGFDGMHIDRFGRGPGPATDRAESLAKLLTSVRRWTQSE